MKSTKRSCHYCLNSPGILWNFSPRKLASYIQVKNWLPKTKSKISIVFLPGHMVGHVNYKGEEEDEPFVQFLSETAHQCLVFKFLYLFEGLEGQHRLRTRIPRGFRMDGILWFSGSPRPQSLPEPLSSVVLFWALCGFSPVPSGLD